MGLVLLTVPVMAQTPMPSKHPAQNIEQQQKQTAERERKLRAELDDIKSDLNSRKKSIIAVAQDIKENERDLLNLEQSIDARRQEQLSIEVRLNDDRGTISDLVLALERVRRVPTEALIARPGAPLETAQSAMLLESVLPNVYDRAEGLQEDLARLKDIIAGLKTDRASVLKTSKKLQTNHAKLANLLSQRESLFARTSRDVKKQQAELKRISAQAKNLNDLVKRIEKKQRDEDARRETVPSKTSFKRTPIPKTGQAQLPISGLIRVGYGKSDEIGAISKGLKIQGRPKALIVAPMGGIVDYAGSFKGYGEIIILKHQKGYHSLIAGLGKIDTVVGRAVSAGEPIGKMASDQGGEEPILYYELRYKGNPVNPSKRIAGLR